MADDMTDDQMPAKPAETAVSATEAAAEVTERGEAVEALTGPLCTYDLDGAMMPGRAQVFVQWKGTDVCLDLHCVCGYDGHLDDSFAYSVQCGGCERVYEMPHTFHIAPGGRDDPLRIAFGGEHNMHVPTGEGVPANVRVYDDTKAEAERDGLRRKVDAVRALHVDDGGTCAVCHGQERLEVHWDGDSETSGRVSDPAEWPCPTIQALGA